MDDPLVDLFLAAVRESHPGRRVADKLAEIVPGDGDVRLIAVGKSAGTMASAAMEVLGDRLEGGVVVAAERLDISPRLDHRVGAHPVPDEASAAAGRALLAACTSAPCQVVALISGGGSAMAAVPALGISLADKVEAISALARSGASIHELNLLRRHISAIKGGRLAAACARPVTTLLVSDVVGDDAWDVASGPTVPDPTHAHEAVAVLKERGIWHRCPPSVRRHLELEPPRPYKGHPAHRVVLVAGQSTAIDAAVPLARAALGSVHRVAAPLQGTVEEVSRDLLGELERHGSLVAGGEPTVHVPAVVGKGGRAQHLALTLAMALDGEVGTAILVAGTDGIDGNSDAAGAVIDGSTCRRLRDAGVDPRRALACFDSSSALATIGAAIFTGPTGVNHADMVIAHRRP